MKHVGETKILWRFLIALILAAFLVPISASPVAAIDLDPHTYFDNISYSVTLSDDEIQRDEVFYLQISAEAKYIKELKVLFITVKGIVVTFYVVAQNGEEVKLTDNDHTIAVSLPAVGGTIKINESIPLQFPEGSQSGSYGIMVKIKKVMVNGSFDATGFIPESYKSLTVGSVAYLSTEETCTLTVSSDGCCPITVEYGEISGEVAGGGSEEFTIACGAEVTLEAVAGECCDFGEWKVDGISVEGNPITVTMDSEHSVTATCTESGPCTLTVSIVPEGTGTISLDPTQPEEGYACGTDVDLTATPSEGYTFSHWSGALSGSANPATIYMDSDKEVTANFSEISYTLTVSSDGCCPITVEYGETSGEVASGGSEEFTITCGADVTLEAANGECCDFGEWKVDGISVEDNPIIVTMNSNHTAVAYCTAPGYTIIASASEGGSISPSGDVTVNCGADQTFTITPDECYKIEAVLVDGESVGAVSSYTFGSVTVDHTISATFAETIHTMLAVNVSPEGSGNIKVNDDIPESYPAEYTFDCGTDDELIAIPNESYVFSHWSGALSGSANPTTIHMDSDKEVTAHFSKIQEMHIASIGMALKSGGVWIFKYTYATATITVVDAEDNPVAVAMISGHWSGATSDSDSGTTNLSGKVTFASNHMQNAPEGTTFTFTVDDVTKSGWTYNASANVETSDSITVGGAPSPSIAFSTSSFTFIATQGGANPANQALSIWNSGGGTLNWSVSDDAEWLSLSPTSGSSTGETDNVTLSVDISGMSAGIYHATITISAPGATNTPRTVPVSLEIIAPDTTSPVISDVAASNVTANTATITWITDEVADSKVDYGETASYDSSKSDTDLVISHSIILTGLEPETTYHYKVTSTDSWSNQASSGDLTFTTLEQPQNIMHIANINMGLKSGGFWIFKYTYATAMVTIVDAESNPVAGAMISGHWSGATSDSDSGTTNSSGKVTFASNHMQNAPEGTTFTFTVDDVTKSGWTYNASANVETSDSITVGGAPSPSIAFSTSSFTFIATQGGANPANQALSIWNSGGGTLNWSVSDDAEWLSLSPTSGSSTGETDNVTLSVDISGMSAGIYHATITISAPGATNTPRTVPVSLEIIAPDTTSPVISDVAASNVTANTATITWITDEVADSKVDYGETASYDSSKSDTDLVISHSIILTGLEPETTYHYKVTSTDSWSNQASSGDLTFTTLEQPQNIMHIANINMGLKSGGFWIFKYTYATAMVTIVDAESNPVAGAMISGHWSGATSDSDSGTTNSSGRVTFASNRVWGTASGTTFTFTVDSVTKSGWTYDTSANVETSDSITVNP